MQTKPFSIKMRMALEMNLFDQWTKTRRVSVRKNNPALIRGVIFIVCKEIFLIRLHLTEFS